MYDPLTLLSAATTGTPKGVPRHTSQKVRELFTPEVLDFFAGQDGVSTEGRRSRLIFYRDGERLKPEDTPAFLEEGLEVFRLFAPSQPS